MQQYRWLSGESPDVARRRLLQAQGRRKKLVKAAQHEDESKEPVPEAESKELVHAAETPASDVQVTAEGIRDGARAEPLRPQRQPDRPAAAPARRPQIASVVDHPALVITRNIEW